MTISVNGADAKIAGSCLPNPSEARGHDCDPELGTNPD